MKITSFFQVILRCLTQSEGDVRRRRSPAELRLPSFIQIASSFIIVSFSSTSFHYHRHLSITIIAVDGWERAGCHEVEIRSIGASWLRYHWWWWYFYFIIHRFHFNHCYPHPCPYFIILSSFSFRHSYPLHLILPFIHILQALSFSTLLSPTLYRTILALAFPLLLRPSLLSRPRSTLLARRCSIPTL